MAATHRRPNTVPGFTRRRWVAQAAAALLLPAWLGRQPAHGASYPITAEAMGDAQRVEMGVYYRYNAFGRQALQEGYKGIAYLFVAFAAAEFVHAGNFGRIQARLNTEVPPLPKPEFKVGTTKDNLITAANGEIHSVDEFYPKLLERIRPEGHQDAMTAVNYAWATEQRHRDKLGQVRKWSPSFFDQVAKSIDAKTGQYFVCQLCGCTLNKLPADACPVCKNPPKHYRHIEPPA